MADYSIVQTKGGQETVLIAAGTTGADAVLTAAPGRLSRFVVTTTATAALEVYDHATATSGAALIYKTATNIAAGTIVELDLPLSLGAVALKANGSAAGTFSYIEDGQYGTVTDKVIPVTDGGQYSTTVAAGTGGAAVVSAEPGRLCKVVVLSSGSAATDIYDNASAASGTKLFTVPANPTIGTLYNVQMPAANGVFNAGVTNSSQLCITYNKANAFGR